jgi:hypothetical protein
MVLEDTNITRIKVNTAQLREAKRLIVTSFSPQAVVLLALIMCF